MANINPKLRYLQSQLADLECSLQKVQLEISAVLPSDILTRDALENRLNLLFENIAKKEQEIKNLEKDWNKQLDKQKADDLADILQSNKILWEKIRQAYLDTLSHWAVKVNQNVDNVQSIINELNKISRGSLRYSALEEFIANLLMEVSNVAITTALNQWGKEYCQDINWTNLYEQIQESQDKRLEKAQPAIVITITRSDEASTQSQDRDRKSVV